MEFCDFDDQSPGYIGAVAEATCNIETLDDLMLATLESGETSNGGSESRGISGNTNALYGSALTGDEYLGEGCSAEFWDVNRYNPIDYAWPEGTDPEEAYNVLFGTDLSIHRVVVTTEAEPTEETLVPLRGRVSSDGVSIGTATLRGETSTEETQTIETTVDLVVPRSASNSVDAFGWAALNTIEETGGTIEGTGITESPSLSHMLTIPDIEHEIGSLNELVSVSVAALLNARHPDIHYYYTEDQVIDITHQAIEDQMFGPLSNELQVYNGRGEINFCPSS